MILRKPYAILIKNFRKIHILLSLILIFIAYQSFSIIKIFANYIENGYTISITDNLVSTYINWIIYIALFLAIIILLAITILLKTKRKPNKIYILAIIYYILLLVGVIVASLLISQLTNNLWSAAEARTYRDLGNIIYYPQYIFIIVTVVRALGFNVKQFNFKRDLKDLEITASDNEEIELNINFETYKAKRTLRRLAKEIYYYFLENKFVIYLLIIVAIIILGFTVYKNYEKVKYTYNEGSSFTYNTFTISVLESMVTNVDLAGNQINKNKAYVVLKMKIKNNAINDTKIDYNNLKLYYGNKFVYPSLDMGSYFLDYGDPFTNNVIKAKEEHIYIIPYAIDVKNSDKNFKLSIYTGTAKKKKDFVPKNIIVNLNPTKVWDNELVRNANMGEEISFASTALKNASLTIKNVEFTTRYKYEYESCYGNSCRTYNDVVVSDVSYQNRQSLIVLDYDLRLDNTSPSYININGMSKFANSFMKVDIIISDKTIHSTVKNVTPSRIDDKLILQVDGSALNADRVNLIVSVRNRSYSIKLK